MFLIRQCQRRASEVGSMRGCAMNQPYICPTIHTCGPVHGHMWRAHGRNTRRRNSLIDLEHGPDFFWTFFGEFLVFASAWPPARYRQMTSLATTETSLLHATIAIMTTQRRVAELAKLTPATAPFGPLVASRSVWVEHWREHNTRCPDTRARVGIGWLAFATGSKSITRRLGSAALAALTAHAITTSRG